MTISIFELFSIGVGPSSSHTVGPMRAARAFCLQLKSENVFDKVHSVVVELFGSLALTGHGHGTDNAILLGLTGEKPDTVNPEQMQGKIAIIREYKQINLLGERLIPFIEQQHLLWHDEGVLPLHSNGMRFTAHDENDKILFSDIYYSIGGGFIVTAKEYKSGEQKPKETAPVAFPFSSAKELLAHCKQHNMSMAEIMMANEKSWRTESEIRQGLLKIWEVMNQSIERGMRQTGILPGELKVPRRAGKLYQQLVNNTTPATDANWLSLYAIAVNEENAAGSRVVTAPTNGAAGTVPAVLRYFIDIYPDANEDKIITYLLTTGAIGMLYKSGASISAAEVGCQGEVGVACSMAAAGFAAARGGNPLQVENAAEIGMEHNLGLTCDPIGGLVQIPCIERNVMGAIQAVTAANLALLGDGSHKVSLDDVIKTMYATGKDMMTIYKETSRGGLAVNFVEC